MLVNAACLLLVVAVVYRLLVVIRWLWVVVAVAVVVVVVVAAAAALPAADSGQSLVGKLGPRLDCWQEVARLCDSDSECTIRCFFQANPEDRLWIWTRYGTAYRALYTLYEASWVLHMMVCAIQSYCQCGSAHQR